MDITGKQKHLNYELKGKGKTACDTTRAAEPFNVGINMFSVHLMRRKWRSPLQRSQGQRWCFWGFRENRKYSTSQIVVWGQVLWRWLWHVGSVGCSGFCIGLFKFQKLSCDHIIHVLHRLRETKCLTLNGGNDTASLHPWGAVGGLCEGWESRCYSVTCSSRMTMS